MFELETRSNADLMLQIRERDEQPYGDPPPSGDEGLDDESDQADNESNDDDGSVGTGIGVKLSERRLKRIMVDAAQMALRLQRKPLRKAQRSGDELRKRRDVVQEEKGGDQHWQRLIFLVSCRC